MRSSSIYSPQLHTFTTGWELVAPVRNTTTATKQQMAAAPAPRLAQRQPGVLVRPAMRSMRVGFLGSWEASRCSSCASRMLTTTRSTSTVRNSRVETALISGVMRRF